MGIIKCVVPGCEDRRSPRHRFPVFDQELYEEWLKRIGNKELINLDPKFVGTNKRICSVHFSAYCRVPNSSKLKNRSLPTLHLPEFRETPNEDNSILKYPYRTQTISRSELIRFIKDFKPDPEGGDEVRGFRSSVSSVPVVVSQIPCNLPNATPSPVTIRNQLPDYKPITADEPSNIPHVDCEPRVNRKDTSVIGPGNTTTAFDVVPVDDSAASDDDQTGDCEPVTIDFTYLMKITSLPDTPLLEESPKNEPISEQLRQDVAPKLALDRFQRPSSTLLHEAVTETSSCGNLISFDLEELIREHCVDLLAEPVTPLVHTASLS